MSHSETLKDKDKDKDKEASSVRFRGLFKNVGYPLGPSSASTPMKPIQSRGTFPFGADFLSGDDQPLSNRFSVRLAGTGRRKKLRKKHSTVGGSGGSSGRKFTMATDDEDSSAPTDRSHHHHSNNSTHSKHHPRRHNFLNNIYRGSRSDGEEVRLPKTTQPSSVKLSHKGSIGGGSVMSLELQRARQSNKDPSILLPTGTGNMMSHIYQHLNPHLYLHQHQQQQHQLQQQQYHQQQQQIQQARHTTRPSALLTKSFLFKTYHNSKSQGHYVFRIQGDQVEYKKLPVALEQLCSQYFRQADVTYRSLEKKAKVWREEKVDWKRSAEHWKIHSTTGTGHNSQNSLGQISGRGSLDSMGGGGGGEGGGTSPFSANSDSGSSRPSLGFVDSTNTFKKKESGGGEILKSSIAWDQIQSPSSSFPSPSHLFGGQLMGPLSSGTISSRNNQNCGSSSSMLSQRAPSHLLHRRRSGSSAKEYQLKMEQLRVEDEAQWKIVETKHHEESQQAKYGLDLFLSELIKGVEYERFDNIRDVSVVNENRDSAVFSILNGDRTNMMWLESPSNKLKSEFLNWITVSLMDRGEPATLATQDSKLSRSRLDMFTPSERNNDESQNVDLLIELTEIRLSQQEDKLQELRHEIQRAMSQINECLDKLDNLDENAKKLMTAMIRAIDSQEIQLALQPSPSTGLTLAETVEWKLRDVNDRIVICTRIMGQARFNLNRLRYEIELEHRSIRLFRQYKIIIAVVSSAVLFLAWFLYHSRASALAPQPASPLFASPVNPYDTVFHHGQPPILPSPTSVVTDTPEPERVPPMPDAQSAVPDVDWFCLACTSAEERNKTKQVGDSVVPSSSSSKSAAKGAPVKRKAPAAKRASKKSKANRDSEEEDSE
ncbi:hypothetical protein BGZ74_009755 [Mortierella antarctica]|nr:hypothetical protein BGZ74_009755 [Mortierella antarctica]